MSRIRSSAVALLSIVLATWTAAAPTLALACKEDAMIVFDASGSMGIGRGGMTKIDIARQAAASVLPHVTRQRRTGLVTYGGERGPACAGVNLRLPPMDDAAGLIISQLDLLEPAGQTPLSDGVWLAAQTLQTSQKPGVIVLVTDGLENCGQNACAVGARIHQDMPQLRVHVIGFDLGNQNEQQIACLSASTGGTYVSTNTLEDLQSALKTTLGCPQISALVPLTRLR